MPRRIDSDVSPAALEPRKGAHKLTFYRVTLANLRRINACRIVF
jgi:hypothetical protein